MAKNLKRMQKIYPNEFSFFPKTWVIPNEINELRYYQELCYKDDHKEEKEKKKKGKKAALDRFAQKHVGFTMICKPDHLS